MKIKNVKKFVRSILIILGIILSISLLISKASLSYKETEYKTISVSAGDTLWEIASYNQSSNNYYENKDIRYIINDIMRINNLENSSLTVDQELLIPVK